MITLSLGSRMPVGPQIQLRPRPKLGEGSLSQKPVNEAALSEIRRNVNAALAELAAHLELVSMEGGLLSMAVLNEDPSAPSAISLSQGLSVQELRTLVYADAMAISDAAYMIRSGATSTYLTNDQKLDLDAILSRSAQVAAEVKATGTMSVIPESGRRIAEDHHGMHVNGVLDLVREAEKAVVSAEAGAGGSVPVLEPYERDEMTNKIIVVGIAAAVIAAVIILS